MQLPVLLLLGVTISVALASQNMPRFVFRRSNNIILHWDKTWEVGGSNMFAILSKDKKIGIRIKVEGHTGSMTRRLKYRCPKPGINGTIELSSEGVKHEWECCQNTIPFVISTAKDKNVVDFELKMKDIKTSKLSYRNVFNDRIEFNVEVEYSTVSLTSNKLFVWSLDAISNLAKASNNPRFLSDEAVTFMKTLNTAATEIGNLTFLTTDISRVLKAAPDFFKAKMSLGSVVYFEGGSCTDLPKENIMFVNYYSRLDIENLNFQKLMRLNIDDGKLYYSSCGLKKEVGSFLSQKSQPLIGICAIVSFSGNVRPYKQIETVQPLDSKAQYSYNPCQSSRTCDVIGTTNPNVTILSGMDVTAIVCPIICSEKTESFQFYKGDKWLISTTEFDNGVRISETGNILEFQSTLSSTHSGQYRCVAGGKSFTFDVKVISLPQFQTDFFISGSEDTQLGSPPAKVFAVEGEFISYHCEVYFASLETVKVSPVFYFFNTDKQKWEALSLKDFRHKIGADETSFYLNETAEGKDVKKLTVTVAEVPPVHSTLHTNFTHRFVCNASIDSFESNKVGMPTYAVQSGSDVVFVPRLTRSHFNLVDKKCSTQNCDFGKGAFFDYSINDDFMAYLDYIGVEVVSYFRLDNDLLTDVKVLFKGNASELNINNAPQQLTYRINPVSEKDVAQELMKRRVLTPVYNFKYKNDSVVSNLRMDKETHGKPNVALGQLDCRADPLCFYSTDFDVGSSLDFLPAYLNRADPSTSSTKAGARTTSTSMITLVIAVLLSAVILTGCSCRTPRSASDGNHRELEAKMKQCKE